MPTLEQLKIKISDEGTPVGVETSDGIVHGAVIVAINKEERYILFAPPVNTANIRKYCITTNEVNPARYHSPTNDGFQFKQLGNDEMYVQQVGTGFRHFVRAQLDLSRGPKGPGLTGRLRLALASVRSSR